jgi:transposase-like protein
MADVLCKHCGSDGFVKNGKQKGCQSYLCKSCKRNFVPPRRNQDRAIEKKLAISLYLVVKTPDVYIITTSYESISTTS